MGRCVPKTRTLYNILWAPADERRAMIINLIAAKSHGCSRDWTLDFRVIDQHLIHAEPWGHVDMRGIILPLWWTYCNSLRMLWLTKVTHSVQRSQADVCKACKRSSWTWCHQALFFFQQWPKKNPLSPNLCKFRSAPSNPLKMVPPSPGSISRRASTKSYMVIFRQ